MKTEIEAQQENLKELIKLMQENPERRVVAKVDSDIAENDDYVWWTGSFGECKLDEIYTTKERTYIKSEDEEEMIDDIAEDIVDNSDKKIEWDDENAYKEAEEEFNKLPWEKVITVDITL